MKRRQLVRDLTVLGVAAGMAPGAARAADDEPTARRIPRWRGFNLQGRFGRPGHPYDGPALEADFAMMAEWGFDFARLPLNYWTWGSRDDWSLVREEPLKQFDRAVELGRQYGVYVNINFHRIPGYCIDGRDRAAPHLPGEGSAGVGDVRFPADVDLERLDGRTAVGGDPRASEWRHRGDTGPKIPSASRTG